MSIEHLCMRRAAGAFGGLAQRPHLRPCISLLAGDLHRVLLPLTLFTLLMTQSCLPLHRNYTLLNTKTSQLYEAMLKFYLTNNINIFG